MQSLSSSAVLVAALLLQDGTAPTGPLPLDGSDQARAVRRQYLQARAAEYEIRLRSVDGPRLVLINPVLRFNDNVTGVVDGILFVWTHNGRPAVAASFWIQRGGTEFHEFQSLARAGLFAERGDKRVWQPAEPGVVPQPIAGAPSPADKPRQRLFQMKALVRQFSASVADRTGRQQLRLLGQPLLRYGGSEGPLADGALFAFCKGTNPEVLLLVEALPRGKGMVWHWAAARATCREIQLRHRGETVWRVPYLRTRASRIDPAATYFNVIGRVWLR